MQEQIESALRKLDGEGVPHLGVKDQNYQASKFLSHVVYDTIGTVVVAARSAMDWLRDAAKIATDGAIPVTWTSPCGFPVQQEYKVNVGQKIEVFYQGSRMYLTVLRDGTKLDKRKQASSISPNFVHSLDAAHLMRTVALCGENSIDDVCVIHDSFATHAANTDELANLLRRAFIEQYTPDVLGRFRDQLGAQLSEELADSLPPLPPMGNLDLASVAESDFFFA
jgi:DNA-directed RNA polymerase